MSSAGLGSTTTLLGGSPSGQAAGHVNNQTQYTLVLGGGGMKGVAHVGVLQALTERGLVPSQIVGSSVGALVGAAWSAGKSIAELREIAIGLVRKDIFAVAHADMAFKRMRSPALFRREPLDQLLHRLVGDITFQDLRNRLIVNTVDLNSGMQVFWVLDGLDEVPVKDAVFASCALPGYLPPREIRGRFYMDGATVDNLPVGTARILGSDVIIAVDVSARTPCAPTHRTKALRRCSRGRRRSRCRPSSSCDCASGPRRRSTISTRASSTSRPSTSITCARWWRKGIGRPSPRSTGRKNGPRQATPACTRAAPCRCACSASAASAAAPVWCKRRPACSCSMPRERRSSRGPTRSGRRSTVSSSGIAPPTPSARGRRRPRRPPTPPAKPPPQRRYGIRPAENRSAAASIVTPDRTSGAGGGPARAAPMAATRLSSSPSVK